MSKFEDFLREKVVNNWPVPINKITMTADVWIQFAEEWHQQELKSRVPSVTDIYETMDGSKIEYKKRMESAIKIHALYKGKEASRE